ncbi:MAG: RNA-directed DNA polymerase [Thermotogota bacterium]
MKRYGNIFKKITTIENLTNAYNMAKRDKMHYEEVIYVEANLNECIKNIKKMLEDKTYTINMDDYKMFQKNDKGKIRDIYKLDFYPHRIIQWAVILQTKDIIESTFISNTFASIPKRGIHKASKKLSENIADRDSNYTLKLDIKKFYPSIYQKILSKMFRLKFKDEELLWLIDTFIFSMYGEKGIAIGSLFSQWAGNFYMTYFDHWIKEIIKIKKYFRYMDDIVIVHKSKKFLHFIFCLIKKYLKEKLDLVIKGNYQIFPTKVRGIDFVGFRHFPKFKLLRKTTYKNLVNKYREICKKISKNIKISFRDWCSINSFKGWLKWCNSRRLSEKYIKPLKDVLTDFYVNNIKRKVVV